MPVVSVKMLPHLTAQGELSMACSAIAEVANVVIRTSDGERTAEHIFEAGRGQIVSWLRCLIE